MTYVDLKVVLGIHRPEKGQQDAVRQLKQAVASAADEVVMRFRAGHLVGKPPVGHIHRRQDALFCQKMQGPVYSRPAQRGSDVVYMVVHGFGRDVLTEMTNGIQDELALGCYPVAGFAQLTIDLRRIVGHISFVCCKILHRNTL